MIDEITKEELKRALPQYVEHITRRSKKGGLYNCPLCGSGTGKNETGAFSIFDGGKAWHCLSCEKGGDIFKLIELVEEKSSFADQAKRAAEFAGIRIDDEPIKPASKAEEIKTDPAPGSGRYADYIEECHKAVKETDYFKRRGFTDEDIERFNLGYDVIKNVVVIPYDRSGDYYITRDTMTAPNDGNHVFRKPKSEEAGAEPIYNKSALYENKPCFICESPIDAISLMAINNNCNAVALGGTGSDKLITAAKENRPNNILILNFDNDDAGRKATEKAAEKLTAENIDFIIAEYPIDNGKDANEMLINDACQLMTDTAENIARADAKKEQIKLDKLTGLLTYETAVNVFEAADDSIIEMPKFPEFSKRAKIKLHDSVVISADTGAGKSSLALNFIDNLNDKYPVIYFNLEMDELTVLRRLVSIRTGIELDRIEGYKYDENTAAAVNSALKILTARQPLQIIQDKYNLSEIEKEIKTATAEREEPTIVVIDHSLLVTTNESYSRYERFTQISEDLRRISRLNNVIMFILLQQNRSGKEDETKRPTNASLKESGSWENDATHIIFLWYDPQERSKKMLLTKNRGGITGEFNLEYYSTTQFYKESKEQPADANSRKTANKKSKRDQERDQLQTWYEKAYTATGGEVTLYDLAEAGGTTTAVIKRRLKEYGGYIVEGKEYDPAGIDTDVEKAAFIRLTMSDAPAFDEPAQGISDIY